MYSLAPGDYTSEFVKFETTEYSFGVKSTTEKYHEIPGIYF